MTYLFPRLSSHRRLRPVGSAKATANDNSNAGERHSLGVGGLLGKADSVQPESTNSRASRETSSTAHSSSSEFDLDLNESSGYGYYHNGTFGEDEDGDIFECDQMSNITTATMGTAKIGNTATAECRESPRGVGDYLEIDYNDSYSASSCDGDDGLDGPAFGTALDIVEGGRTYLPQGRFYGAHANVLPVDLPSSGSLPTNSLSGQSFGLNGLVLVQRWEDEGEAASGEATVSSSEWEEDGCGRASSSPSASSFLEDAFHEEPVPEDAFPNDPFPEDAFPKEDAGTAEGGILESIRTIFDRMCLSMG